MSSPLFDAAKKNAAMAYKLDQGGQTQQSIRYYVSAAEQLQKLINFTDDPNMKNLYYQKAMEYILRVKEIRGIVGPSDAKKSSSTAASPEDE
jgi:hypothetical protein